MRTQFENGVHIHWKNRRFVVASRTDAVLFGEKESGELEFIRRLRNPSGRKREGNLTADRPGTVLSSAGQGTIRHSLDRNSGSHEQRAKKFAATIARTLSREAEQSACQGLVLVAEPHFLGLLRAELPERLRRIVVAEIPRELVRLNDREIAQKVFEAIRERTSAQIEAARK